MFGIPNCHINYRKILLFNRMRYKINCKYFMKQKNQQLCYVFRQNSEKWKRWKIMSQISLFKAIVSFSHSPWSISKVHVTAHVTATLLKLVLQTDVKVSMVNFLMRQTAFAKLTAIFSQNSKRHKVTITIQNQTKSCNKIL